MISAFYIKLKMPFNCCHMTPVLVNVLALKLNNICDSVVNICL